MHNEKGLKGYKKRTANNKPAVVHSIHCTNRKVWSVDSKDMCSADTNKHFHFREVIGMINRFEIEKAIPEIRVCNIDERCAKSVMLPRVIVDFVYRDNLKTLFIYLDNNKINQDGYVISKVINAISTYVGWFDNNIV